MFYALMEDGVTSDLALVLSASGVVWGGQLKIGFKQKIPKQKTESMYASVEVFNALSSIFLH